MVWRGRKGKESEWDEYGRHEREMHTQGHREQVIFIKSLSLLIMERVGIQDLGLFTNILHGC
jgi:hypothetical protein